MYAVTFNLDPETLSRTYTGENIAGYKFVIDDIFKNHGFKLVQGNFYLSDSSKENAVSCILAIMDIAKSNSWFSVSIKDMRMFRIDEEMNLMPLIEKYY